MGFNSVFKGLTGLGPVWVLEFVARLSAAPFPWQRNNTNIKQQRVMMCKADISEANNSIHKIMTLLSSLSPLKGAMRNSDI